MANEANTEKPKRSKRKFSEIDRPNKIAYYRKKFGFNQGDVQEITGLSQQVLSKVENGEKAATVDYINLLLDVFKGITYDELFTTGRLSVYINKQNEQLLNEYMTDMQGIFSGMTTDFEKKSIIVNHILKIFLQGSLSDELRRVVVDQMKNEKSE